MCFSYNVQVIYRFTAWRGHSSLAANPSSDTTREVTVTGYKSNSIGVGKGRHGLPPTVGEIIAFHRSVTARHKLGSPQPVRYGSATVCLLRRVRGAQGSFTPTSRSSKPVPKKNRILRIGTWNVRTMCPGINTDLDQIQDVRKTAINSEELNKLGVDIAALQETKLAETGSLREAKYSILLVWQVSRQTATIQCGLYSEKRIF